MSDAEDAEDERVTAHSYGAMDVADAASECWLIRFPQKLAALLEKVPEGTPLGELVFTKGGSKADTSGGHKQVKPAVTVHFSETLVNEMMAQEAQEAAVAAAVAPAASSSSPKMPPAPAAASATLPLNYSLQAMTKKVPVMHPFTRNPKTGSVKVLGTVSRTANLQVEQDSNYRQMLKDRLVATNITSSRFVKPVETTESVMNKQQRSTNNNTAATSSTTTKKRTFGNAVFQFGKRMLEASQETSLALQLQQQQGAGGGPTKKARQFSPDQPIRSVIFELFGQQRFWTVKDLKAAAVQGGATAANTKRAETEIRDVLREIGEYHRSGDHKNMWELRKEFQHQS